MCDTDWRYHISFTKSTTAEKYYSCMCTLTNYVAAKVLDYGSISTRRFSVSSASSLEPFGGILKRRLQEIAV